MLTHPNFDPIVFSIGPLAVRWYGLMYLLAFAAFWWLGMRRIKVGLAPLVREQLDDLLFGGIVGVILGGRLGYVLFYKPAYYFSHPRRSSRSGRAACRSTEVSSACWWRWRSSRAASASTGGT